MKNNTNANVNGKQHDRKTNEEDRRLGQKIRELTEKSDLIVRRKKAERSVSTHWSSTPSELNICRWPSGAS